ncbi:MAG: PH domain-containing protein [Chloroflexales bacterium]|nr:PH domain-containing protein [Chloroflexales bacterium]
MAYVDELLGRGESILYIARQHIFVLISRIFTELVLIGLLVAAGVVANAAFNNPSVTIGPLQTGQLILLITLVISAGLLLSGLIDYLRWNNEQYIITDRRVIQIRGVLNKEVIDSSLEKINDVELSQSWLGRIFDYGTIEVLTASESGVNAMDRIGHPLDFKRSMLEAKHQHDRGYGYFDPQPDAADPAHAPVDIERTIAELAALRDRGILSTDEFETKKRELLDRI